MIRLLLWVFGALFAVVATVVATVASAEALISSGAQPVAASTAAPAVTHTLSEGFDFSALGQLLAGLVLVLVLFVGLAWLVKRSGVASGFSHQGLKVIATLPLSARERLVLVQAGSKQLLLGVAPGRVNLLESFDQPLVDESKGSPSVPFSHWLQRAVAKSKPAATAASESGRRSGLQSGPQSRVRDGDAGE